MYKKEIKIDPPLAKWRFMLINNYDKLLHVTVTYTLCSLFWSLSPTITVVSVVSLQIGKEVVDRYVGDSLYAIITDLIADSVGWLLFLTLGN